MLIIVSILFLNIESFFVIYSSEPSLLKTKKLFFFSFFDSKEMREEEEKEEEKRKKKKETTTVTKLIFWTWIILFCWILNLTNLSINSNLVEAKSSLRNCCRSCFYIELMKLDARRKRTNEDCERENHCDYYDWKKKEKKKKKKNIINWLSEIKVCFDIYTTRCVDLNSILILIFYIFNSKFSIFDNSLKQFSVFNNSLKQFSNFNNSLKQFSNFNDNLKQFLIAIVNVFWHYLTMSSFCFKRSLKKSSSVLFLYKEVLLISKRWHSNTFKSKHFSKLYSSIDV